MPTLRLGNLFSDSNNGRQQRPVVPRPQVPNTPQRNDGLHGTERRAMAAFDDMLGIETWRLNAALKQIHTCVRTWLNVRFETTW